VLSNAGAQPGDRLLFTKALGTGVITTAIKNDKAKQSWIDAAIRSMTTLNKTTAEVITTIRVTGLGPARPERSSPSDQRPTANDGFPVHAMTDVTGFGMIAHAREMSLASNVSLKIYAQRIPLLEGALDCVRAGYIPGGLLANRDFAECVVEYKEEVPEDLRTLLFDPQTAGGLLIAAGADAADEIALQLNAAGVPAIHIGEVIPRTRPLIEVGL
jgi:selenide,water dikinase